MHGIVGGANEFLLQILFIAFSIAMHGNTVAVISWKFCPHIRELYFIKNFQLFEVYTNAVSHDAHGGIQNNRLAA